MKDIYDLLNEIEISENEINMYETEVSDIEKAKVLKNVKIKINKNKKHKFTKVASFILLIVLISSFILNKNNILAINNSFKNIFNTLGNKTFEENSKTLNLFSSNENGSLFLDKIIFDGDTGYISYAIKTTKPTYYLEKINFSIEDDNIKVTSTQASQTDMYTTIGIINFKTNNHLKNINFNLSLNAMYYPIDENLSFEANYKKNIVKENEHYIRGDNFKFNISVNALNKSEFDVYDMLNDFFKLKAIKISPIKYEFLLVLNLEKYPIILENLKNKNLFIMFDITDDLNYKHIEENNKQDIDNLNKSITFNLNILKNGYEVKKLYLKPKIVINTQLKENAQIYKNLQEEISLIKFDTLEINLTELKTNLLERSGYHFSKYSNKLDIYKENENGIFTVNEIIFDGKEGFISYSIKPNEKKYHLYDVKFKIKGNKNLKIISSSLSQNNEGISTGIIRFQSKDYTENINFTLSLKNAFYYILDENTNSNDIINSKKINLESKNMLLNRSIDFKINAKAYENISDTLNNKVIYNNNNFIEFKDFNFTPIITTINLKCDLNTLDEKYSTLVKSFKEHLCFIDLEITDDFGNKYYNYFRLNDNSSKEGIFEDYSLGYGTKDFNTKKLYVKVKLIPASSKFFESEQTYKKLKEEINSLDLEPFEITIRK